MAGNSFPWMKCELMQKLKTRVVKDTCNPDWNEEMTLAIVDIEAPIKLVRNQISFPGTVTYIFSLYEVTGFCFCAGSI